MKLINFVFFEGISPVSNLIKKVTGSKFSHVGYYNNYEELLIECWNAEDISIKDFLSLHPIRKINEKFCWKESDFKNHKPGTPYTILSKMVPNKVHQTIDTLFKFVAHQRMPYDLLGLLGRLSKKFNTKYGFYCSEGVQDILNYVSKYFEIDDLTDISVPGYKTDPGSLYYILEAKGYIVINKSFV